MKLINFFYFTWCVMHKGQFWPTLGMAYYFWWIFIKFWPEKTDFDLYKGYFIKKKRPKFPKYWKNKNKIPEF